MIADPRETGSAARGSWDGPASGPGAGAGAAIRPPCPSMTRRASGSARPSPPRFSSNAPAIALVCRLYGAGIADDHHGCALAVLAFRAAARRPRRTGPPFSRRTARKMASNAARSRVASPVTCAAPSSPRTSSRTSRSLASCTCSATSDDQGEDVDRLTRQRDDPAVELGDVAHLGDQRDQPGARFLGLVDHFPLAIVQLACRVALQHAQVAADDAGRRPEFVNGKTEELEIAFSS